MDANERARAIEDEMNARFGKRGAPSFFRAPGRIDVMGSHTDYNQGLILAATVDRDVMAGARPRRGTAVNLYSLNTGLEVRVNSDSIEFDPEHEWANYPKGVIHELLRAGIELDGVDLVFHGEVPVGGNLSSSAALEAATLEAVLAVAGATMAPWEKAVICKQAENSFVGLPCGIMDQFTVIFGERDAAILLDCHDLQYQAVPFPRGEATMLVIDSGQGRELVAGKYAERVRECRAAMKTLRGRRPEIQSLGRADMEDVDAMRGELGDVLHRRARHVIGESARVEEAAQAMRDNDPARLGKIMETGYRSARDDYENSTDELDALHEIVSGMSGVFGARVCGAGWGGCLLALVERDRAEAVAAELPGLHRERTGLAATVWAVDPSAGAGPLQ